MVVCKRLPRESATFTHNNLHRIYVYFVDRHIYFRRYEDLRPRFLPGLCIAHNKDERKSSRDWFDNVETNSFDINVATTYKCGMHNTFNGPRGGRLERYERDLTGMVKLVCPPDHDDLRQDITICMGFLAYDVKSLSPFSVTLMRDVIVKGEMSCDTGSHPVGDKCFTVTFVESRAEPLQTGPGGAAWDQYSPGVFLLEMLSRHGVCGADREIYTERCNSLAVIDYHDPRPTTPTNCPHGEFRCSDGNCVSEMYILDGHDDCPDGSDERAFGACILPNAVDIYDKPVLYSSSTGIQCSCLPHLFTCPDGRCLPWVLVCDGKRHCQPRGEDEAFCPVKTRIEPMKTHQCSLRERPDLTLLRQMNCETVKCFDESVVLPISKLDDLLVDCPGGEAEDEPILYTVGVPLPGWDGVCTSDGFLTCIPGHPRCFPISRLCVYERDSGGHLLYCRNGAHLSSCIHHQCSGMFKCPSSYCVPPVRVCDGVPDCEGGHDETECKETMKCQGFFLCKGGGCVHPDQVCDGQVDCLTYGDDEQLCSLKTYDSTPCSSFHRGIECHENGTLDLHLQKSVFISGDFIPPMINGGELFQLSVSVGPVPELLSGMFKGLGNLLLLNLANLQVEQISVEAFTDLTRLRILLLDRNNIHTIEAGVFLHMASLQFVNISSGNFEIYDLKAWNDLSSLEYFDISNNDLISLDINFYETPIKYLDVASNDDLLTFAYSIPSDKSVYVRTNMTGLCCWTDSFKCDQEIHANCPARLPSVATGLVAMGWIILILNFFIIVCRWTKFNKHGVLSYSFVAGHICNSLLGVYLIIVGTINFVYQAHGDFIAALEHGRKMCMAAATLQSVSLAGSFLCKAIYDYSMRSTITSLVKVEISTRATLLIFVALIIVTVNCLVLTAFGSVILVDKLDILPLCSIMSPHYPRGLLAVFLKTLWISGIILSVAVSLREYFTTKSYITGSVKQISKMGRAGIKSKILYDNVLRVLGMDIFGSFVFSLLLLVTLIQSIAERHFVSYNMMLVMNMGLAPFYFLFKGIFLLFENFKQQILKKW